MCVKSSKRDLQVNVRLSAEALELMRRAAEQTWPDVPLTNSTLLLTLAHKQALQLLDGRSGAKRPKNQ